MLVQAQALEILSGEPARTTRVQERVREGASETAKEKEEHLKKRKAKETAATA